VEEAFIENQGIFGIRRILDDNVLAQSHDEKQNALSLD
jgi:hypothetical protein